MLIELHVKNLGIIEETEWHLESGLNVITGETGTGKSLVIDALEALFGARLEASDIRSGSGEARIEGICDLPESTTAVAIRAILTQRGIPLEDESLIISCTVRRKGRSVFRLNGDAVPRSVVQQIGDLIIDIQGQSQHLSLLEPKHQLDLLDKFGETFSLRSNFNRMVSELHRIERALSSIRENSQETARRIEFLELAVAEIDMADLRPGQEKDLQQEKQVLASAEKLKSLSYRASQILNGDDLSHSHISTLDGLCEAVQLMQELAIIDATQQPHVRVLEEASYGLQEIARDVKAYSDSMEYDPERMAEIESRLEIISRLKRKYGNTISEILDFLARSRQELVQLSGSSITPDELEERAAMLKEKMGLLALQLSQSRRQAAEELASRVHQELDDLGMAQVEFRISITPLSHGKSMPMPKGDMAFFDGNGIDYIELMSSTNPGEPLEPLAKIASAGEMSRFMLALRSAFSQSDDTPIVVFDEIDIGVGGRSGEVLGRKLWSLARHRQVICITHLPQIAAFADAQYHVVKKSSNGRTISLLELLDAGSRQHELASMLSGPNPSETALNSASELLLRANEWKKRS